MSDSARISPTAHYTSFVWWRKGLAPRELTTTKGRVLHAAMAPIQALYRLTSRRPDLDDHLTWRHLAIDAELERAIASGEVGQVLEIAAGLSARGTRFMSRRRDLTYVEADLPEMAAMKRRLLDAHHHRSPSHLVVALDALADDGEDSIASVCARLLDPEVGTAVITEGLIGYFDEDKVRAIWRRVAAALGKFPAGLYLADLFVPGSHDRRALGVFSTLLAWFARGSVHLHFAEKGEGVAAASEAGFARAAELEPDDPRIGVRILAARTR